MHALGTWQCTLDTAHLPVCVGAASKSDQAAGYAYLASVVKHRFLETTVAAVCDVAGSQVDPIRASAVYNFFKMCATICALWAGACCFW